MYNSLLLFGHTDWGEEKILEWFGSVEEKKIGEIRRNIKITTKPLLYLSNRA